MFKIPKQLGACADLLYTTRQERLGVQKQVDELADREKQLKEHLINNLPKSEASGVAGKEARAQIVTKAIPKVTDWDAFYQHIAKTKEFDLFQRRLNDSAVQERWDNKKKVPGVEAFNAVTVSVTKV